MKRFLSILLATLMLVGILPLAASAASYLAYGYLITGDDVSGVRTTTSNGNSIEIYKAGTYTVSTTGTTEYGLLISTQDSVTLIFEGVSINRGTNSGCGILTYAKETKIILADGTQNSIYTTTAQAPICNADYGSGPYDDSDANIVVTCEHSSSDHDCDDANCGVLSLYADGGYAMSVKNSTIIDGGIVNAYSESEAVIKSFSDGNNKNEEKLIVSGGELWLYADAMSVDTVLDTDIYVEGGALYMNSRSDKISLDYLHVEEGFVEMYVYGAASSWVTLQMLTFDLPAELCAEIYTGSSKSSSTLTGTIASGDLVDHSTITSGQSYWRIETKIPLAFAIMTPNASASDLADHTTDLGEVAYGTTTVFGFVPKTLAPELVSAGYTVKEKVYVNYDWQGTLATRTSGGQFDLMQYVNRVGEYQVWFQLDLYKNNSYVTSNTHIYEITVVPCEIENVIAYVDTPYCDALPGGIVGVGGEGYEITDVDWSYYDEQDGEFYLMPDGMTFEAGKRYECAVQFETLTGYVFPENRSDFSGKINGVEGYVPVVYDTTKAYITAEFIPEVNPNINVDWGKTEEDIIKSVEYVLNDDGTYNAHVTVDLSKVDGQMLQHEWQGTGYYWYDTNNTFHSGTIGGLGIDDLQFTIRDFATNLEPGKTWRVKVYLSDDYYADYEWQGYNFNFVTFTVPSATNYMLGDVDDSGEIDQFDYLLVKRAYFNTYALTDDESVRADVDISGEVDQMDYLYIKRHYFETYVIG